MKKKLIIIAVIAVLCLIVGLVVTAMFLGSIIKKGVETVGPPITKTTVKLDSASLSVLSGSGSLKGFVLGNPEGYQTESSIKVRKVSVGVQPGSVFSDKVHVTHVYVEAPEITFEAPSLNLLANNLSKILANVQAATGGSATNPPAAKGASKKIQIDDFVLRDAKVHVHTPLTVGKQVTVILPEIHFTELGKGTDGVTAAEVTALVLNEVIKSTLPAVKNVVANLGKVGVDSVKDLGKSATSNLNDATKSLKGLLGK